MKFTTRLLTGLTIAGLSSLASLAVPQYAWCCGWLGASAYFIAVVMKD